MSSLEESVIELGLPEKTGMTVFGSLLVVLAYVTILLGLAIANCHHQ